jgi:hypothetical protein
MGNEVLTRIEIGDQCAEAKALLETDEIIVRGALKARIPFAQARDVAAKGDVVTLQWNATPVRIHVGRDAAKWAEKIRNPKSVLDKLGIRPGQKISVLGRVGEDFLADLASRGADVSQRPRKGSDVIFLAADSRTELEKLEVLRAALAPAGAVWVLRPKGRREITENDVMAYAKNAGLVDVKVVRFSETHTAEKLVIPLASRS